MLPSPYGDCRQAENYTFMKCMTQCVANYMVSECKCRPLQFDGIHLKYIIIIICTCIFKRFTVYLCLVCSWLQVSSFSRSVQVVLLVPRARSSTTQHRSFALVVSGAWSNLLHRIRSELVNLYSSLFRKRLSLFLFNVGSPCWVGSTTRVFPLKLRFTSSHTQITHVCTVIAFVLKHAQISAFQLQLRRHS